MYHSDRNTRIHRLDPVDPDPKEAEAEAENLRKAQENAIAWNDPENMKKLRVYEEIFDQFMEEMKAKRIAKYESLNQALDQNTSAEEGADQEAPATGVQEQV